jgi:hypothetical protein
MPSLVVAQPTSAVAGRLCLLNHRAIHPTGTEVFYFQLVWISNHHRSVVAERNDRF